MNLASFRNFLLLFGVIYLLVLTPLQDGMFQYLRKLLYKKIRDMFGLRHEPKIQTTQKLEGQVGSDVGDWLDGCLLKCFRAYAQKEQRNLEQDVESKRRAGILAMQLVMGICL